MNLNLITQRLEIAFWTTLIRLMKSRRNIQTWPILGMGSLCILMTLLVVSSFSSAPTSARLESAIYLTSEPPAQVKTAAAIQSPVTGGNGQRNLLLIGVDQLNSPEPKLEAVWLVLYIPPTPHVTLLPLYPTTRIADETVGTLADVFQLTSQKTPAPAFLEAIQAQDLWWDHYILLDGFAVMNLVELSGGIEIESNTYNGRTVLSALAPADEDPQAALVSQVRFINSMCQVSTSLPFGDKPDQVFDLLSGHLTTDFDVTTAVAEWQSLHGPAGSLSCEFPTVR